MVKNTISKPATSAAQTKQTGLVEYQSNGELVKLSPDMIRRYLVNGGGSVTDQEVTMFLSLCRYQHLNPFLREAYLIKYGSNSPATIVTGKDVLEKRAARNPRYEGKEAGIIVVTQEGEVEEREGCFYLPGEKLVGGWARVYITGRARPEYESVSFTEYAGRKASGELNGQWAKMPATMIKKVAIAHALRAAFPEEFGAMYAPEEIADATAQPLPDTPVEVVEVETPVKAPKTPRKAPEVEVEEIPTEAGKSAAEATVDDIEAAIFG